MRKSLWLLVIPVILIAACVQLPWQRAQVGPAQGVAEITDPDILVQVSAFPTEVRGGRNISVTWNLTNRQVANSLADVNVDVYDQCLFSGDATKHLLELRAGRSQTWSWKWTSQETPFERDCAIKFKVNWTSDATIVQDINVLSDTEYYTREQAGTLADLSGLMTSTTNPVSITLRFSDPLPWLTGSTVYMYIDVADTGNGLISKLPAGSINISVPSNLDAVCDGYRQVSEGLWSLDRDLNFVNKAAPSLTCTFNTTTNKPVSTGTLGLTANYKYELDNSFTVNVKTK